MSQNSSDELPKFETIHAGETAIIRKMGIKDVLKSPDFYEMICVVQLGLGSMLMFTGFDTHSFIVESVLHSVNERDPARIGPYAGYYGQAVDYVFYTIANLFAPLLIRYANAKWSLFAGSLCFTIYQIGFLYLNNYYYYVSSALMGIGFAVFYAGHGCYLVEHSTKKNIERNFSVVWAIGCLCMTVGGLILLVIFESEGDKAGSSRTRNFSDEKIRLIFGAFSLLSFLSNVTFLLLQKRKPENALEDPNVNERKKGFWGSLYWHQHQLGGSKADDEYDKATAQINDVQSLHLTKNFCGHLTKVTTFQTFTSPKLWLLSFSWIHLGLSTCFWLGPYPTTFIFSDSLSKFKSLIPFYACSLGFGEVLCGLLISHAAKKMDNFGRLPTVAIAFVTHCIAFVLILLSTPRYSSLRPNNDGALVIEPSYYISLFCGFLLGFADACWNMARNCIVATLMQKRRAQGFSLSKLFQSLASCALYFLSPVFDIYAHITIQFISLLVASVTFAIVAIRAGQKERKISNMQAVLNTRHYSISADMRNDEDEDLEAPKPEIYLYDGRTGESRTSYRP
ncbi:UNC93-like protein MFSD11 [Toxocara canis]|uniref:UNC93-like protein MFSD11 n=1 Tax=Toxocara canis TaxID=6265 RepID=A0A0B2VE20_TOXCA|nr:UNC93-like protein MFSD11 [Toxocara canis]